MDQLLRRMQIDPTITIRYKIGLGQYVDLNLQIMTYIDIEMTTWIASLFAKEEQKSNEIMACTNKEELDAIQWMDN